MVIPPAGADDGMLADVGWLLVCVPDPVADVAALDRPGVNVGGSGANAPSMHSSAQKAKKNGKTRVIALCRRGWWSSSPYSSSKDAPSAVLLIVESEACVLAVGWSKQSKRVYLEMCVVRLELLAFPRGLDAILMPNAEEGKVD